MGNYMAYPFEEDDDEEHYDSEISINFGPESIRIEDQNPQALGYAVRDIFFRLPHASYTDMPLIRKRPDLRTFRHTPLYKEIKGMCGLPVSSKTPNERFSLQRSLMKRESGIGGNRPGSFTRSQQRRIANMFIPNQKESRLMSVEKRVFLCKHNQDGSRLITASQDTVIRIFDSSKGTYHRINRITAKDVHYSFLDLDISPCGQYIVYSTWGDYLQVLPINGTEEEIKCLPLSVSQSRVAVFSTRFTNCGRKLIGACNNSCIYIVDRETQSTKKIRTLPVRGHDINALCNVNTTDNNLFMSGCNHGVLKLWDTRCLGSRTVANPVAQFIGHYDGITYIDSRNDGFYMLSNSKDQSVKIWDLRNTSPTSKTTKFEQTPSRVWDYRWDTVPREYYNATSTLDGDVSVMTYRGHRVTKTLLRAKFSPTEQTGNRYIYAGCGTGRIIIYDVLTGQIKEAIEGHKDVVRDLSWHPVRSEIISSSWDSHINLNTFKANLRKYNAQTNVPLRRSRRIAHQNGELEEEDDEDDSASIASNRRSH